jgi:hypothetical protein
MRVRWPKSAVAGLALALVWATAIPACAAGDQPERINNFNLEGSNGYRLLVEALPPLGRQRPVGSVRIIVFRDGEFAFYSLPARVTKSRIVAKLGSLGEIDIRFHSGGRGVTHPVCGRDYPIPYEKGFYTGTVEFHGEGGYTEARSRRIRLSLHPSLDFFYCTLSVEEELGEELPGARLEANVGGRVYVRAIQNAPGEVVKLRAYRGESRGRIQIFRVVEKTFPATAFEFDLGAQTAALHPPAPFSGSALFRQGAGEGERWTGDLAVDLPGRSHVPLAGSQFEAALDPARWTEEPPEFERPNLLASEAQ